MDGRAASLRLRPIDGPPSNPKTWALKGDTARLYGEDAFTAPPGSVFHLCEGETDVESFREAGEVAVVGTPGCTIWRDDWTDLLIAAEPRTAIVWFDGDPDGQRAGKRLQVRLQRRGLRTIRATGIMDGGDVNDLLPAGRLPDALRRAGEYVPASGEGVA